VFTIRRGWRYINYRLTTETCPSTYCRVLNEIFRFLWPRGLRRGSAAARLLGLPNESRLDHGCLFVASVVYCQVEISATGWSLVQRSPTECDVSECDREFSILRIPWPTKGFCAIKMMVIYNTILHFTRWIFYSACQSVITKKPKVKFYLCTSWKYLEHLRLKLHSFLTSALDGSVGSSWLPGRFTLIYLMTRRLGGPQIRYGHFERETKLSLKVFQHFSQCVQATVEIEP
jgi:hypothetical protein